MQRKPLAGRRCHMAKGQVLPGGRGLDESIISAAPLVSMAWFSIVVKPLAN
ncbi:MAG: hypothetical protein WAO51_04445 [Bacillota bacterium]|jgi:hypothetical protein|nr:hypothetical protein [Bacillota bacterium]